MRWFCAIHCALSMVLSFAATMAEHDTTARWAYLHGAVWAAAWGIWKLVDSQGTDA